MKFSLINSIKNFFESMKKFNNFKMDFFFSLTHFLIFIFLRRSQMFAVNSCFSKSQCNYCLSLAGKRKISSYFLASRRREKVEQTPFSIKHEEYLLRVISGRAEWDAFYRIPTQIHREKGAVLMITSNKTKN